METGRTEAASHHPPATPQRKVAVYRREGVRIAVYDLDTSAYIFMPQHRVPVVRAVQLTESMNEVTFYDPESRVEQLTLDFVNSDVALYADAMRRLKKILERLRPRR